VPDDDRAPMDAEPLGSLPGFDIALPESLENGPITAASSVALSVLAFRIVPGPGWLVTPVVGFLHATVRFTVIYELAWALVGERPETAVRAG